MTTGVPTVSAEGSCAACSVPRSKACQRQGVRGVDKNAGL